MIEFGSDIPKVALKSMVRKKGRKCPNARLAWSIWKVSQKNTNVTIDSPFEKF